MPNITLVETEQLVSDYCTESSPFTADEIVRELNERIVPNDYEDEAMRGGIRPTRPHL